MSSKGLIGPYFKETVNGQTSLQKLKIMILYFNALSENNNEVYFQYGTPTCFNANVRHFLDHTFSQRWIGKRGSAMDFPPQSPILTPLTFEHFSFHKPQTLKELRDKIEHAINDIPSAIIQVVCRSVRHTCWECAVVEDEHFEHVQV